MYEKQSQTIKECIKLETSPVAVKVYENEEDAIKTGIEKIESKIIHCQAIITAGKGESFYATKEELGCPLGIASLGLTEFPEDFLEGAYFNKMNVTSTLSAGEKLVKQVPKMNKKIEAITYSPLEETMTTPDVIVIIAKPRQIFDLIRANAYINGERVESSVGGTQSLCGDIVVNVLKTKKTKISFGCIGSHYATELREDQVIMGIPTDILDEFTEALKIVIQPPQ